MAFSASKNGRSLNKNTEPKFKIGDLVLFKEEQEIEGFKYFILEDEPMSIYDRYIMVTNPKNIVLDKKSYKPESEIAAEEAFNNSKKLSTQVNLRWMVTATKQMFTPHGHDFLVVKITKITTESTGFTEKSSGWVYHGVLKNILK